MNSHNSPAPDTIYIFKKSSQSLYRRVQPSGLSLEAAAYTVTPGPRKRGVYSRFWRQNIVESAALGECFFLKSYPLAGLGDGQALVDICREGPAGHSQSPGLAMEGVGGRSPARLCLSCVTQAGPSLCTQQAKAACPGHLPKACQS